MKDVNTQHYLKKTNKQKKALKVLNYENWF